MTAASFIDDLVRDYLLYRGFVTSLKHFDLDVKNDKDKGFRADKIVDQLCSYVATYDLNSLREVWNHLEQRIFSRLELSFMPTVRKLENSLLKMYIVNTVQTNRHDKLMEFFEKAGQDLQNQPEWKDWFVLPFLKNPEENSSYAGYFSRQWQDTMLVSLHNFLSVIFQYMPVPALMSYEEEMSKIKMLQDENEMLRQQVYALQSREFGDMQSPLKPQDPTSIDISSEPMDDFYILAQETPNNDSQPKSIRSIIKNISSGLPTSPILGRRPSAPQSLSKKPSQEFDSFGALKTGTKTKIRGSNLASSPVKNRTCSDLESKRNSITSISKSKVEQTEENVGKRKESIVIKNDDESARNVTESSDEKKTHDEAVDIFAETILDGNEKQSPLILLSQEDYSEHRSAITHCKFNASGCLIASSDSDGIIKVWSLNPSPLTLTTIMLKSSIFSLEWAAKQERLLLHGGRNGIIRLYDTKEKKMLYDTGTDFNSIIKDQNIVNIACSPTESYFISSTAEKLNAVASDLNSLVPAVGKLYLWDLKNMKILKPLISRGDSRVINCSIFNHNGQLLIVGNSRGWISLFDMRSHECINQWQAHDGEAYTIELSPDETSCYSIGSGGKFCQWSINKTGQKISEHILHESSTGPFISGNQYHRPVGRLFSVDLEGKHVMSSAGISAVISKLPDGKDPPKPVLRLDGHQSRVITMDWATTINCSTCITASLDGRIRVSTLLAQ